MHIDTNDDTRQTTDDTGNISSSQTDTGGDSVTSDPILSKHLDIAIEAQDGKPKAADTSTEAGQKDDAEAKGGKTPAADSTSSKTDTTAQPKPNKEGKEAKGNTSGPKDLVLKGQGPDGADLVIKGGSERRFYEQLQTARQQTQHLTNEVKARDDKIKEVTTRAETAERSMQAISSLPPAHLSTAVRMFTDLQRDPAGTLKKLLAEAVALGHTVEGIGQGVDVAAITAAIRSELATKETAREPSQEEIVAAADAEVNTFYSRFPDARPHDALLGAVMRDHPDLSLEAAYFQLKDAFAEKGFDWSLPIEENVRQASGGATLENKDNAHVDKPLPGGRTPTGSEPIEKHKDVVMSENSDMGDIVRAAMRENGLNV